MKRLRSSVVPIGPFERREEARPAGAALELAVGDEQRLAAADAGERPGALLVQQRAGAGPLGAVLAQHLVLLRRQLRAPFRVASSVTSDTSSVGHRHFFSAACLAISRTSAAGRITGSRPSAFGAAHHRRTCSCGPDRSAGSSAARPACRSPGTPACPCRPAPFSTKNVRGFSMIAPTPSDARPTAPSRRPGRAATGRRRRRASPASPASARLIATSGVAGFAVGRMNARSRSWSRSTIVAGSSRPSARRILTSRRLAETI